MELNNIISRNIMESRLYNLNKPEAIKDILLIPDEINIKYFGNVVDGFYDVYYIEKRTIVYETKQERHNSYVEPKKINKPLLKEKPQGVPYRRIVNINKQWLKKSQRRFNRILMKMILTNKTKGIKQESIVPYLHSSVKLRSYATNAFRHIGDKYVLSIDLKDFYPSVTKMKIYNFFRRELKLDKDIAMFYAYFSTSKNEENEYVLAQGLPQSAMLAYLINYSLFNYLYDISKEHEILMTLYVDDIIFSSEKPIPQSFIDRLFGLFLMNDLKIKKQKINLIGNQKVKKITGVYVHGNKTRVANKKHEEISVQLQYLSKKIFTMKNIEDYFEIYNIYLRFYGNYQHVVNVEKRAHDKYNEFIEEFDSYFPKGVNKRNKQEQYTMKNIKNEKDKSKLNGEFQRLNSYIKSGKIS